MSGIPASGDRDTAEKLHTQAGINYFLAKNVEEIPQYLMLTNLKGKKRVLYLKR